MYFLKGHTGYFGARKIIASILSAHTVAYPGLLSGQKVPPVSDKSPSPWHPAPTACSISLGAESPFRVHGRYQFTLLQGNQPQNASDVVIGHPWLAYASPKDRPAVYSGVFIGSHGQALLRLTGDAARSVTLYARDHSGALLVHGDTLSVSRAGDPEQAIFSTFLSAGGRQRTYRSDVRLPVPLSDGELGASLSYSGRPLQTFGYRTSRGSGSVLLEASEGRLTSARAINGLLVKPLASRLIGNGQEVRMLFIGPSTLREDGNVALRLAGFDVASATVDRRDKQLLVQAGDMQLTSQLAVSSGSWGSVIATAVETREARSIHLVRLDSLLEPQQSTAVASGLRRNATIAFLQASASDARVLIAEEDEGGRTQSIYLLCASKAASAKTFLFRAPSGGLPTVLTASASRWTVLFGGQFDQNRPPMLRQRLVHFGPKGEQHPTHDARR